MRIAWITGLLASLLAGTAEAQSYWPAAVLLEVRNAGGEVRAK